MAIQLVNLTVPGGDTPRSANTKINANFTDTTHAASKTVGLSKGQVPLVEQAFMASHQVSNASLPNAESPVDISAAPLGSIHFLRGVEGQTGYPDGWGGLFQTIYTTLGIGNGTKRVQTAYTFSGMTARLAFRGNSADQAWAEVYTNKNTTKDSNGFIKGASPIVDLYSDRVELNADAEKQSITFERVGTGDYLVKGSLGFAQEGWYVEMPKDANGNVLVAVVYEQLANNDISVKTYAKTFDVDTGDIVANTSRPRDIPEGRFISLRLHEEPVTEYETTI